MRSWIAYHSAGCWLVWAHALRADQGSGSQGREPDGRSHEAERFAPIDHDQVLG